ncbi:uncharacterized protein LOC144141755 [Haemaphysalis longicornis]
MYQLVNNLLNEVRELQREVIDKDNDIKHLKGNMTALQKDIKSDDINLLRAALSAFRDDLKSVQIRCETRISGVEKLSTDFMEQRVILLETLDFYEDELKKELKKALASGAVRYEPGEKWRAKRH